MDKRVGHDPLGRDQQKPPVDRGVVDLADARVRIRSRAKPTTESLTRELDEVRSLLDQGLSTEAQDRLAVLISNARHNAPVLALARCALSTALEQQGHYRDSLAAVAMYEDPESRAKLDDQTVSYLRVQIGLGYNYNGDHPKAIAMLKATLRDYARFGQFVLDEGRLRGDKLLPDGWTAEAGSAYHIGSERIPYGYMWWIPVLEDPALEGTFQAEGIYGQFIHINPHKRLVVVVLSARSKPSYTRRLEINDDAFFAALARAL